MDLGYEMENCENENCLEYAPEIIINGHDLGSFVWSE